MIDIELRAVDPVRIRLRDGTEVVLLLTFGALRRTQQATGAAVQELLQGSIAAMVRLLYECICHRPEWLTLERFEELLPADMDGIARVIEALMGVAPEGPRETPSERSTG